MHWTVPSLVEVWSGAQAVSRQSPVKPLALPKMVRKGLTNRVLHIDSLWPIGMATWMAPIKACCLMAPSHYLNQSWFFIVFLIQYNIGTVPALREVLSLPVETVILKNRTMNIETAVRMPSYFPCIIHTFRYWQSRHIRCRSNSARVSCLCCQLRRRERLWGHIHWDNRWRYIISLCGCVSSHQQNDFQVRVQSEHKHIFTLCVISPHW